MSRSGGPRTLTVAAARLPTWVSRFDARHPGTVLRATDAGFDLSAPDGARATVESPLPLGPAAPRPAEGEEPGHGAAVLAAQLERDRDIGLLLVRRGGYGVARLRGPRVAASKVGRRYVQGRTAAGGWSQQRFARRRDKQTAELVGAAVSVAVRLLAGRPLPEVLVTGGDRALVERALADPALRHVAALPRGGHLAVGDPREEIIREVAGLLRSARITVTDTMTDPMNGPGAPS